MGLKGSLSLAASVASRDLPSEFRARYPAGPFTKTAKTIAARSTLGYTAVENSTAERSAELIQRRSGGGPTARLGARCEG